MRLAVFVAMLSAMTSCGSSTISPELKHFQQEALPGTTPIRRVVVSDRRLGRSAYTKAQEWDLSEVDEKVFAHLRANLPAFVQVDRARGPRDTTVIQVDAGQSLQAKLMPGTIYVSVLPFPQHALNGPPRPSPAPSVWVQGSAIDVGSGDIRLFEQAPGDIPCRQHCSSAEDAFKAIRGRLDAIALRIRGDKSHAS